MWATRPALYRYASAVGAVAVALLLVLAVGPFVDRTAVVFFVAAVAIAAWLGGLGPSLVATALSLLAVDYILLPPAFAFDFTNPESLVDLLAFGGVAVLVSSLNRNLLVTRRRAEAASIAADAERARVANVLESISDAFLSLDRDWRYSYLNTRAITMTRLPAEGLLGKRIWDVYPQLVGTPLHQVAMKAMHDRTVAIAEHNITGTETWLEVRAYPSDQGISLYFQDITTRKQAEQALYESEHRLRLATTAARIGHFEIDWIARTRQWSPELRAMLAVPNDLDIDQDTGLIDRIIPPVHRARYRAHLAASLDPTGSGEYEDEHEVIRLDGTRAWMLIRGKTFFEIGPDGPRATRTVGMMMDITERKRSEERLRFLAELSDLLNASLEYQPTLQTFASIAVPTLADWCAIDMVQPDGSLERLAVEHQDPAKIELAHDLHRRYPPAPDDPAGVPNVIRTGVSAFYSEIPDSLLVAGARDQEHLKLTRELGLRSAMVVPLTAHGRTLGAITFVLAESDRRYDAGDLAFAEDLANRAALAVDNARLFQSAQEAQRRAEDALRVRDTFISVVSHDLRNPLASIKGYAQLMRRRAAYDERAVERIEAQTNLLERLIGDLVDVAALQSERLALRRRPTNLTSLVDDSVDEVQRQSPDHRLRVKAPEAPIEGSWDPDRLGQVLQNLLSNAVKYSPDGGEIVVEVEDLDEHAQVSVRDTGLGIPAEALPRLFDQFYRVRTRDGAPGLGLGLYIARTFVEAHGGRIWAESDGPGHGSTFRFTLPYQPPRQTPLAAM